MSTPAPDTTLQAALMHEFGNRLAILMGYVAILKDPGLAKEHAEVLSRLDAELQSMHRVSKDLLHVQNPDNQQPSTDVSRLVTELGQRLQQTGQLPGIRLEYDLQPQQCARVGAVALQQVVHNLLLNAAHAIAARPSSISKAGVITVRSRVQQQQLLLEIADNGTGISERQLAKIFQPFYSTKAPQQGSGLGLFVVEQLLKNHHASIQVKSQLGVGTTFTLVLPLALTVDEG